MIQTHATGQVVKIDRILTEIASHFGWSLHISILLKKKINALPNRK